MCSVVGCERPLRARKMCTMHYARTKRLGSPGAAESLYDPDRVCSVEGCGQHHQARGWCQKHYTRWRVTGDPLIERKPGVNVNPRPVSPRDTWRKIHHHLQRTRGKARQYACKHCGNPAKDWCYDNADPDVRFTPGTAMPFSAKVEHYIPLCGSCHKRFDNLNRARDVISETAILRNQQKTIESLQQRIEMLEEIIDSLRKRAV